MKQWIRGSGSGCFIFLLAWILLQLLLHFPVGPPANIPRSEKAVVLYSNQTEDHLTQIYQRAIENAQLSLTLVIYGLADHTIIQSLKKKCEEGIAVHLVCDANATKNLSTQLPGAVIINRLGKGLMHQKILIVDNRQILLGSANLTYSSLNIHGNLVIGMENPILAKALTERAKSMDDEGGFTPLLHQVTTSGPQAVELWVLPDDQEASKRMIELFRAAQKSIRVAMFMWTRADFTQELITASKRGVKVEVVIDRNNGKGAGAKIVNVLEKGGIPVTLSTGQGLLHHKFACIDEKILVNGSANWTHKAFHENDDYFLIVNPLTAEQQIKMNRLFQVIKKQSEKPDLGLKK